MKEVLGLEERVLGNEEEGRRGFVKKWHGWERWSGGFCIWILPRASISLSLSLSGFWLISAKAKTLGLLKKIGGEKEQWQNPGSG